MQNVYISVILQSNCMFIGITVIYVPYAYIFVPPLPQLLLPWLPLQLSARPGTPREKNQPTKTQGVATKFIRLR